MSAPHLVLFFAFTFAISWTIFFTVDAGGGLNPLFLAGVFAPSAVALSLTAWSDGARGVEALLGRITRWDVAGCWYAFAILYMAVIKVGAAVLVRLTAGEWPALGDNLVLIPFAIAISTPFQAGEEIGWRGYALPHLSEFLGVRWASVVLGVLWALWHLPLFYVPGTDTTGQSFPVYTAQVTALSVALAWLYLRTGGSLLLVMLTHSAINQVKDLVPAGAPPSAQPWTYNASPMSWFTLALLWICATYFLVRMRSDRFEPPVHPQVRS